MKPEPKPGDVLRIGDTFHVYGTNDISFGSIVGYKSWENTQILDPVPFVEIPLNTRGLLLIRTQIDKDSVCWHEVLFGEQLCWVLARATLPDSPEHPYSTK